MINPKKRGLWLPRGGRIVVVTGGAVGGSTESFLHE
jgi:hypothetical protein